MAEQCQGVVSFQFGRKRKPQKAPLGIHSHKPAFIGAWVSAYSICGVWKPPSCEVNNKKSRPGPVTPTDVRRKQQMLKHMRVFSQAWQKQIGAVSALLKMSSQSKTTEHSPTPPPRSCTHTGPTVRQQTQQTVKSSLLRISNNRTFRVREKE